MSVYTWNGFVTLTFHIEGFCNAPLGPVEIPLIPPQKPNTRKDSYQLKKKKKTTTTERALFLLRGCALKNRSCPNLSAERFIGQRSLMFINTVLWKSCEVGS